MTMSRENLALAGRVLRVGAVAKLDRGRETKITPAELEELLNAAREAGPVGSVEFRVAGERVGWIAPLAARRLIAGEGLGSVSMSARLVGEDGGEGR